MPSLLAPIGNVDPDLDDVVVAREAIGAGNLDAILRPPSQGDVDEFHAACQFVDVGVGLVLRVMVRCGPWSGKSGLGDEEMSWIGVVKQPERLVRLVVGNGEGPKIDPCDGAAQGIDLDLEHVRGYPDLAAMSRGAGDILQR